MDPLVLGMVALASASAAGVLRMWRARIAGAAPRALPEPAAPPASAAGEVRVGDVLTHLGDEYWLAGEIALVREGATALRLFTAPERGKERWIALPRDGRSVWVLFADEGLAALGWPGVEAPAGGKLLRRTETGTAALVPRGEGLSRWEGHGRFALFSALDAVAVVLEGAHKERLALLGREIPRQLVQKLG